MDHIYYNYTISLTDPDSHRVKIMNYACYNGFQFKKSESVHEHFMHIDHELCHEVFMNYFMKIHEEFMKR
jgi:hypothetical protein